MDVNNLALSMLNCYQTKNQTVFEHGVSVYNFFNLLIEEEYKLFKLPDWYLKNKQELINNIHDKEKIDLYTRFHDCGKPFCKIVDENGKIHFPNHAEISKNLFFEATGNLIVSNLIGWDMILHTESAEKIQNYLENIWSKQDAYTLLIISLCEIHSNANMFGGIESDSFKIKWKKINQRGCQILKFYNK